jgi:hypothetical protein
MSTRHQVSQDQTGFTPTESTNTPPSSLLPQRVHATLAISPFPLCVGLFWYWFDRGKAYPWWVMWQVKRSLIIKPTSTRSLIDLDRDTTPRLPSRASHPPSLVFIIYNPKVWYMSEVHLFRCWTHHGHDGFTIKSFLWKIPIPYEASSFVKIKTFCFLKQG